MAPPDPADDQDAPSSLVAEHAKIIARVRQLMAISGLAAILGIAAIVTVIGYRVFRGDGSRSAPVDATVPLPNGARVIATAVAGDRIVVTIDIGGMVEIRTYDARTLRPEGRLRFYGGP